MLGESDDAVTADSAPGGRAEAGVEGVRDGGEERAVKRRRRETEGGREGRDGSAPSRHPLLRRAGWTRLNGRIKDGAAPRRSARALTGPHGASAGKEAGGAGAHAQRRVLRR